MSLDEAQRVVAETEDSPSAAVLSTDPAASAEALSDIRISEAQRRRANAEPPPQASDVALANFHRDRGIARRLISDHKAATQDMEIARDLAIKAHAKGDLAPHIVADILFDTAIVWKFASQPKKAADRLREANAFLGSNQRSRRVRLNAELAHQLIVLADFDGAAAASAFAGETLRGWDAVLPHESRMSDALFDEIAIRRAEVAGTRRAMAAQRGDFDKAVEEQRLVVELLDKRRRNPRNDRYWDARRVLGQTLRQAGRGGEGEIEIRSAIAALQASPTSSASQYFNAVVAFSRILTAQGRPREGEAVARRANEIGRPAGLGANRALADALAAQERWSEAVEYYRRVNRNVGTNGAIADPYLALHRDFLLTLAMAGSGAEALRRTNYAERVLTERLGADHRSVKELVALRGLAHAGARQYDRALAAFDAAIPMLLAVAGDEDDPDRQRGSNDLFLRAVVDAHIVALAAHRPRDPSTPERAFTLAQSVAGRSVQRALAASGARAAARDPALARLVRQQQDAERRIQGLEGVLVSSIDPNTVAFGQLRAEIARLREAHAAIASDVARRFPAYAALINPAPLSLAAAQKRLRPDEAMIVFHVGRDRSFAWALPSTGTPIFRVLRGGRDALARDVDRLLATLAPNGPLVRDMPAYDLDLAHALYADLLAPIAMGWQSARKVMIVADGPLGALPFHALVTEPTRLGAEADLLFANYRAIPWLIRKTAIARLPSVASLALFDAIPPGDPTRGAFVGFGAPRFAADQPDATRSEIAAPIGGRSAAIAVRSLRVIEKGEEEPPPVAVLPPLPDTADELLEIARVLRAEPERDVVLGSAANVATVRSADLRRKVIAFATHGLIAGDIRGLQEPALALSPAAAGGSGDGLLRMSDIASLKVDADWVVLSACNSGAGQGAGAESVSGLGRAFFYAGARAVLVTNWAVETTSAKGLTTALFRRQAADPSLGRSRAFRGAMLDMIDKGAHVGQATGRADFGYAHPFFWAPFSLIGHGRGGNEGR